MTTPASVPFDYADTILEVARDGATTKEVAEALRLSENLTRDYLFILRKEGRVRLRQEQHEHGGKRYFWYTVKQKDVAMMRRIFSGNPEEYWSKVLHRSSYA